MPPKLNGHDTKLENPLNEEDFKFTKELLLAFHVAWLSEKNKAQTNDIRYGRLSVVAMSQIAAITAVDLGMTTEQFTAVCRANFEEAHKRAPKFG